MPTVDNNAIHYEYMPAQSSLQSSAANVQRTPDQLNPWNPYLRNYNGLPLPLHRQLVIAHQIAPSNGSWSDAMVRNNRPPQRMNIPFQSFRSNAMERLSVSPVNRSNQREFQSRSEINRQILMDLNTHRTTNNIVDPIVISSDESEIENPSRRFPNRFEINERDDRFVYRRSTDDFSFGQSGRLSNDQNRRLPKWNWSQNRGIGEMQNARRTPNDNREQPESERSEPRRNTTENRRICKRDAVSDSSSQEEMDMPAINLSNNNRLKRQRQSPPAHYLVHGSSEENCVMVGSNELVRANNCSPDNAQQSQEQNSDNEVKPIVQEMTASVDVKKEKEDDKSSIKKVKQEVKSEPVDPVEPAAHREQNANDENSVDTKENIRSNLATIKKE